LNDWTLLEGDCLRLLPTLDAPVDAVITDPPYGIDYQSARRIDKDTWKPKIANDKQPFVWFLHDAYRVTREGGALLCFCRWDVAEAFRLAIEWAGYTVKSQVIWDRDNHGLGDLEGAFAPQHDIIWHACKGKSVLNGKRPTSVVRSMRLSGEALTHPNEKPVALMRYLVRAVTAPGDTVLDCFAGSGATGTACLLEGRRFIGIEQDAGYCTLIRRRLDTRQATMELAV
jgi:DNA modification methylase